MEIDPERVLDPVCGMTVDVAKAEADGLTVEHESRTSTLSGGLPTGVR